MHRCSMQVLTKSTLTYIAHRDKVYINAVRSFYNDEKTINYLVQELRKRHTITELKYENPEREAITKEEFRATLSPIRQDISAPELHHFFTFNWSHWWNHKKQYLRKRHLKERYAENEVAGPDIATGKAILAIGGKVKFANFPDWINITDKEEVSKIPKHFQPDFVLEGLDLRRYPIDYENLHTICNLHFLKWLILRGCSTINDWSLDKLSAEYPRLEYLDVSECKGVTDKGLIALYRMPNLKKLIVTDYLGTAAFELSCLMLEDVNPYLRCRILKPRKKELSIYVE